MEKRTYTKEEKDKILDSFRKRVLLFVILAPIILDLIIVWAIFHFFGE